MSEQQTIDTGDVVFHRPSGERWVVACVIGARLSWCGWPEGSGDLSDCSLLEKASPEKRLALLRQIADMPTGNDHRARYARLVLGEQKVGSPS